MVKIMHWLKGIIKYVRNKDFRFCINNNMGLLKKMPDEEFIKRMFKLRMNYELDLENPHTFNEKLQWLKLYDRKPIYTTMVDKYAAKKYVADIIGEEYIIPTYGIWDHFDDINFDQLPDQFVLKCTHDSGGLVIVRDKSKFDIKKAKKKIEKSLKKDYYLSGREWPYKDVPHRIIAEKYMEDNGSDELRDYKFFCFNGQAKCFKVDFDRFKEHHANYFDLDGNVLKIGEEICPPDFRKTIKLPDEIDIMKRLSEKLSEDNSFLRADFYDVDGNVYFGELTFYPSSGFGKFIFDGNDEMFGQWLSLPNFFWGGVLIFEDLVVVLKKREKDLTDYKFFCFNGKPKIMYCSKDHAQNTSTDFFDMDYNLLPIRMRDPNSEIIPAKPQKFEEMKMLAKKLSQGLPHLRVDFYCIGGRVFFGELTFYHCSGFVPVKPEQWNRQMGEWIELPTPKR